MRRRALFPFVTAVVVTVAYANRTNDTATGRAVAGGLVNVTVTA